MGKRMNVETQDITIIDADGERVAVGWLPAEASALIGMSHEEILSEMKIRVQAAAEKAYRAGFDAHRSRVTSFLVADRREMIKAVNQRGGR